MIMHRHRRMSWAAFTVLLSALLSAGTAGAAEENAWTPIAEDGVWTLSDGRQVDLSAGWRVVEHRDTGVQRVLPLGFGTADWTMENVSAWDFEGKTHGIEWGTLNNRRTGIGATAEFIAPLQVSSGLRVRKIELDACDTTQEGEIRVWLERCPISAGVCDSALAEVGTDVFLAPGCTLFEVFPDPETTIDNLNYSYRLRLRDVSETNVFATRFFGVRVFLQRQVSPPPATATFGDVPTGHPFFQHIEALAASGITGGCGGGDFCPNGSLTRGQMAVFLAKALGLHWGEISQD